MSGARDYGDVSADEVGGQGGQAVGTLLRPAIFDGDVAPFDIAHLAEALAEAAQPARVLVGGGAAEEADHRYPLLRAQEAATPPRRLVPRGSRASSFDHLVGAGEERGRDREIERLSGSSGL